MPLISSTDTIPPTAHPDEPGSVLLTGATGFLGRHVLHSLRRRGRSVVALAHQAPPADTEGARWISGDLLEAGNAGEIVHAAGCRRLMHLAWQVPEGGAWSSPVHERWLQATGALVEAFAERGDRALCVGTCAEYVWDGRRLSERSSLVPSSASYGSAKARAGHRCGEIAASHGLSLCWGRVFFTFGPGEAPNRLVPAVVRAALADRPAEITSGRQRRDFLYVEDLADALVAVLDSGVQGGVNLGSGQDMPVRELARAAASCAGGQHLLRVGALPERPGEPEAVTAAVDRLADEVGWRPAIGIEQGLRRTVDWWRAYQDGPNLAGRRQTAWHR